MRPTQLISALILLVTISSAKASDEKGWFGLEVKIEIEGIAFNPVLHSATITKIAPSSPAAAAGLVVGDSFVEIQGQPIPGAKARDLKEALHQTVGSSLHLRVKHGSADPHAVTLVAIAKP